MHHITTILLKTEYIRLVIGHLRLECVLESIQQVIHSIFSNMVMSKMCRVVERLHLHLSRFLMMATHT